LLLVTAACGPESDDGSLGFFTAEGDEGVGTAEADASGGASDSAGDSGTDSDADASSTGDGGSSGGGDGPSLDVGAGTAGTAESGSGSEYCDFVDIVFVIDNSASMGPYQAALGTAFPMFADTLVQALPAGVNVHVGVTSSEMGFSGQGSTSVSNGECTFTGDNGQPNDFFYITPDVMDTGRNGAQGRLFDPGTGATYYEFYTDDPPDVIAGLGDWFAQAATLGTSGSNIEMMAAPSAWALDTTVNQNANDGFLRDQGSALVLFYMTDEPDQTPTTIEGQDGGAYLLDKIAAAKAGCGGLDCVLSGGFLNYQQCSEGVTVPLDVIIDTLGANNVAPLPEGAPQAAAEQMNELLSDTLAGVIADLCDTIPPID
jgi:hypothetical protein